MNQAEKIKKLLLDDISNTASDPHLFAKNPDRDFSRHRKFTANDVLSFPIFMERDTLDRELLKFFDSSIHTPSLSAYYQQRRKLLPDTYRNILFTFNDHFSPTLYKHRYILIAVDGSGFNIPRNPSDTVSYNPPNGKSKLGFNEIHVVASYLLTDRVYADAVIQPCKRKNEYSAICSLVDATRTDQGTHFLSPTGASLPSTCLPMPKRRGPLSSSAPRTSMHSACWAPICRMERGNSISLLTVS